MCNTNKKYFQVLTYGHYSEPVLQSWHHTKEEADEALANCESLWPDDEWWIEEGTAFILEKCRECGDPDTLEMYDAYGYSTGHWCEDCYDKRYSYRKDAYFDEGYAGERLEDDY